MLDRLPPPVLALILRLCAAPDVSQDTHHQEYTSLSAFASAAVLCHLALVCRALHAAVSDDASDEIWAALLFGTFGERSAAVCADDNGKVENDGVNNASQRVGADCDARGLFVSRMRQVRAGVCSGTSEPLPEPSAKGAFFYHARRTISKISPIRLPDESHGVLALSIGMEPAFRQLAQIAPRVDAGVPVVPVVQNNANVTIGNQRWQWLGLGGQEKLRPLWRHFLGTTTVLVVTIEESNARDLNELVHELWRLLYPNCLRDYSSPVPVLEDSDESDRFVHCTEVVGGEDGEVWQGLRADSAERFHAAWPAQTPVRKWPPSVEEGRSFTELPRGVRLAVVVVNDQDGGQERAQLCRDFVLTRLRPWLLPVARCRIFFVDASGNAPYDALKAWIDEEIPIARD
jgi:ADP-ribosylation factor family